MIRAEANEADKTMVVTFSDGDIGSEKLAKWLAYIPSRREQCASGWLDKGNWADKLEWEILKFQQDM